MCYGPRERSQPSFAQLYLLARVLTEPAEPQGRGSAGSQSISARPVESHPRDWKARCNPVTIGHAWSSCPDAKISLVNVFALQVMRPMAARACPMLGGSADSQRRQASILMTRAANDSLIWGATVVDRLDSLTGWDPWKTGDPSCRPLSCTSGLPFLFLHLPTNCSSKRCCVDQ